MQKVNANPYLNREERKALMQRNDLKATWVVLKHWSFIVLTFALVYVYPNPLTIILALFLLGGQQLGCSILMHDTAHYALFNNRKLNDWVGQWLGAFPIFQNLKRYRPYHLLHHQHTGLEDDPDLLLTRGYPTSPASMRRKFIRDFTGQTGIKSFVGLTLMNLGFLEYNLGKKIEKVDQSHRSWSEFWRLFLREMGGSLLANFLMWLVFYLLGAGWLYLLWPLAYLTTFQFSIRVRSIAEHSMVEDPTDPLRNTRTTKANFIEKLLFAPYNVNYHAEHHMLMSVPPYNLPKMHQLLFDRGFYEKGVLAKSYWEVIKMTMR